jgi:multisubunit Na+/H+ antiporter MnhB subunit
MAQFAMIVFVPVLVAVATTMLVHGVMLRNAPFYVGAALAALAALGANFFGYNRLLYWTVEHNYSGGLLGDQTNVAIVGLVAIALWLPACVITSVLIWMRKRNRRA